MTTRAELVAEKQSGFAIVALLNDQATTTYLANKYKEFLAQPNTAVYKYAVYSFVDNVANEHGLTMFVHNEGELNEDAGWLARNQEPPATPVETFTQRAKQYLDNRVLNGFLLDWDFDTMRVNLGAGTARVRVLPSVEPYTWELRVYKDNNPNPPTFTIIPELP